jgi:hypothetical protein
VAGEVSRVIRVFGGDGEKSLAECYIVALCGSQVHGARDVAFFGMTGSESVVSLVFQRGGGGVGVKSRTYAPSVEDWATLKGDAARGRGVETLDNHGGYL